jgi:hypothetical protein
MHALVIGAMLLGALPVAAQETEEQLRARILKAWKDRQDKVKSARFVWKEVRTVAMGAFAAESPTPQNDTRSEAKHTYDTEVKVTIDGDNLKYHFEDSIYVPGKQNFKRIPITSSIRNGLGKILSIGSHDSDHASGIIQNGGGANRAVPQFRPVLLTFRGVSKVLRPFSLEEFVLSAASRRVNKRSCVEWTSGTGNQKTGYLKKIYLDKDLDYVLCREVWIQDQRIILQIDINYESRDGILVPKNWAIKTTNPRKPNQPYMDTLVQHIECELNVNLKPDETDIIFPSKCIYVDNTKPSVSMKYRDLSGMDHELDSTEFTLSFEELSAKKEAHVRTSASSQLVFLVAAGVLLLSIALFVLFRRSGLPTRI